ncbi:MAG: hypothetical protein OEZ01_11265 [Candidatus Heimdallarchaeota archaeon]|nr:hypothetical protein [Candidatus Heimdallarchaeota archaeon]MDH5646581.1 hypothetical protein [Candidatus Heimdallarchaeota archaeon]
MKAINVDPEKYRMNLSILKINLNEPIASEELKDSENEEYSPVFTDISITQEYKPIQSDNNDYAYLINSMGKIIKIKANEKD